MKITITCFILVLMSITSAVAQEKYFASSKEAKDFSVKCSTLFKENKLNDFFKELRAYWPLPENEIGSLEDKTIQYMNLLKDRFGATEGVVKIKEEVISDFAIKETYILRFENSAVRLIYVYYKNKKGWVINMFKWDDSFTEEFK
ncbi:hypothetical protein [Flavobacterium sp. GCM10023249]|uniref:hypothetical protein n=1 Tax=unclassified Flavobacterium TaxID=196869 RepID=UPI00360C6FF6